MKYKIDPKFSGVEIKTKDKKLFFKNKLFSLSSEIKDEQGHVIATLERKGWWNLCFHLTTGEGTYEFIGKRGRFHIISEETGEHFNTDQFGVDLYSNKGVCVTEFSRISIIGNKYYLVIHNEAHEMALLMASCVVYKKTIEANHMSIGCCRTVKSSGQKNDLEPVDKIV